MIDNSFWKIELSKEKFEKLKHEESFLALLTLARVVNSLRFCQLSLIDASNDNTPSGLLKRISSFLFSGSILFEGFKIAETLGKYYKSFDTYTEGIAQIIKDKNKNRRFNEFLGKIRNFVTYHYDYKVIEGKLSDVGLDHIIFVEGKGSLSGEVYYRLADDVFLHILGILKDDTKLQEDDIEALIAETIDFMNRYTSAADKLISEACEKWGVDIEEDPYHA